MKAVVNETCIGCGMCVSVCPEVFKYDDDGKAVAFVDNLTDEVQECATQAKDICPVDAIDII